MNKLRLYCLDRRSINILKDIADSDLKTEMETRADLGPQNAGHLVEIIKENQWIGTLALVLYYWVRGNANRRVRVTTRKNGTPKSYDISGYLAEDAKSILEDADQVDVLQIQESSPTSREIQ